MQTTRVILKFQHDYNVEVDIELPGSPGLIKQFYFPDASTTGGKDGITIRVIPENGPDWIGIFEKGYLPGSKGDGVYSYPDKHSLLVVSSGTGYLVRADDPATWQIVSIMPITAVYLIEEKNILILVGWDNISAYGPLGLRWKLERVVDDELSVISIKDKSLWCRGLDFSMSDYIEFAIDIESGERLTG